MEKALLKARVNLKTDVDSILYAHVWANDKEIISNGLQGFRRDTIYKNMIETLFKGEFTADNIDQITYIPYSNGQRFEIEVNNTYSTSQGIIVPIMAAKAHYKTYLSDLNRMELINLIDKEEKLEHYPGLMFGSVDAPNNNAGNWE